MLDINIMLLGIGLLLFVCVLLSKVTSKIGIPSLVIFLFIGLCLDGGSFISPSIANYTIVQYISIFALIIIMFSGGLDTDFDEMRPVSKVGISLATVGVVLTAFIVGILIHLIFHYDLLISLLIGSIISSTDAAAIFSIFKSQNINIKNKLDNILELESATNDPVAYLLVTSVIYAILHPSISITGVIFLFFKSLILGAICGYVLGKVFAKLLARLRLSAEGLYPVLLLSTAILSFAITEYVGGNGFLAVYLAALLIGNCKIKYKKTQLSFFDGIAWVMQVVMFVLLGVFTLPNDLIHTLFPSILIALILIFIARPIAVLVSLAPFKMDMNSKIFLSWTGIKGAIPIVFAFYPLVANIHGATMIFNIVMVITFISVIFQGSLIKTMAKRLNLLKDESST